MAKMNKKRIITIAGRPASGKSTTSRLIAEKLGFDKFSSGDLFRRLASERGIDVLEANLSAEQNSELDDLVDAKLREIGETGDRLVIDSRLAWHWMPDSFKVFLNLDLRVAAERILSHPDAVRQAAEKIPDDPEEYAMVLQSRLDSEIRRYKALYDIDPYDFSNYDLVIDTLTNSPDESVQKITTAYQAWLGAD
jgi:cytidylate kinase